MIAITTKRRFTDDLKREAVALRETSGLLAPRCRPRDRASSYQGVTSGDFLWDRAAETVCRKPLDSADDRHSG